MSEWTDHELISSHTVFHATRLSFTILSCFSHKCSQHCRCSNRSKCSHIYTAIVETSEVFGQLCWRAKQFSEQEQGTNMFWHQRRSGLEATLLTSRASSPVAQEALMPSPFTSTTDWPWSSLPWQDGWYQQRQAGVEKWYQALLVWNKSCNEGIAQGVSCLFFCFCCSKWSASVSLGT